MAAQKICAQCYSVVKPKTATKGSCLVEGALWLFLIVPGIIYSVWRLASKDKVCPVCGGKELVPLDTPRGRTLQQQQISAAETSTPAPPIPPEEHKPPQSPDSPQ